MPFNEVRDTPWIFYLKTALTVFGALKLEEKYRHYGF
jgi:hypothetical protein